MKYRFGSYPVSVSQVYFLGVTPQNREGATYFYLLSVLLYIGFDLQLKET